MRRPTINVFSMSFLDLFSCALAGVIILMLVFVTMLEGRRADRRVFIFTAELSLTRGEQQSPSADSGNQGTIRDFTSLLQQDAIDPRKHIEAVLVDPRGREIALPQTFPSGVNKTLLHYTAKRPPHGQWQLLLRPSEVLKEDFSKQNQQAEPNLPPTLSRLRDLYDRHAVPQVVRPTWAHTFQEIQDDLRTAQAIGSQNFEVLQRTLIRLRAFENHTRQDQLDTLLTCLETLTTARNEWRTTMSDKTFAEGYPSTIRRSGHKIENILATAIYLEIARLLDRTPPYVRMDRFDRSNGISWALYNAGVHFWPLRESVMGSGTDNLNLDTFVYQCGMMNHFQLFGSLNARQRDDVRWKLLALMTETHFATSSTPGVSFRYELSSDGKTFKRKSTVNQRFPPEVPLVASHFELVRLAQYQTIKPVISTKPEKLVLLTETNAIRERFAAWLEQRVRQNPATDSSVFEQHYAPLLFYFHHLRTANQHKLDQLVDQEMQKLTSPAAEQENEKALRSAAEYFPILFLGAFHDAIKNQKLTIEVNHVLVHWGSQLRTEESPVKINRSLLDIEPIVAVELYPDELFIHKIAQ